MAPLTSYQVSSFAANHIVPRLTSTLNITNPIITPPVLTSPSTSSEAEIKIAILAAVFGFGSLIIAILQLRRGRATAGDRIEDGEATTHMTPVIELVEHNSTRVVGEAFSLDEGLVISMAPGSTENVRLHDEALVGAIAVETIDVVHEISRRG